QSVHECLQVGEVHAIPLEQLGLIPLVGGADGRNEGIAASAEGNRVDQLLRDLVEVVTHSLDRAPLRRPLAKVRRVPLDDVAEVIEEKEELGQLVERLVARTERRVVAELEEDAVAEPVDRA